MKDDIIKWEHMTPEQKKARVRGIIRRAAQARNARMNRSMEKTVRDLRDKERRLKACKHEHIYVLAGGGEETEGGTALDVPASTRCADCKRDLGEPS